MIIVAHDYNNAVSHGHRQIFYTTNEEYNERLNKADSIVNLALAYQDVNYLYGGKDPEGFDCSGFAYYIFKEFNVAIPGSSRTQYGYGQPVSPADIKKGDLVFFTSPSNNSTIGHVGIVISDEGDEMLSFIHSSSGKANGITIDSLAHPYYSARFVGARRILGN